MLYDLLSSSVDAREKHIWNKCQSTGLISGGIISINLSDNTLFDIELSLGIVVIGNALIDEASLVPVSFGPFVAQLTPYLNTADTTYIGIDINGDIVFKDSDFTDIERRSIIRLGWVDHPDRASLLFANTEPIYSVEVENQLDDFMESLQSFTIYGNKYKAATGLKIQKTEGMTFDNGANFLVDRRSPHRIFNPAEAECEFVYFYRDGLGGWVNDNDLVSDIDSNHWDNNGIDDVPVGKWTIQVISLYPVPDYAGNDIQLGQRLYDTLEAARCDLNAEIELDPFNSIGADLYRCFLIVKQGATNLTDSTQALFINAGKFGLFDMGDATYDKPTTLDNLSDVEISNPQVDQVVRFNGSKWINSTPGSVSAGTGISFYFANAASGISDYETIQLTPDIAVEQDESTVVNNNTVEFEKYSTILALNRLKLDAGVWVFNAFGYVSTISGVSTLIFDVYKRSSVGVETLLFSVESEKINNLSVGLILFQSIQPEYIILSTDRLVIKVKAKTTNTFDTTVHFIHSGTVNYSFITSPLSVRHNDLSGIQGGGTDEAYHLTLEKYNTVLATSGANTGDETQVSIITKLGYTPLGAGANSIYVTPASPANLTNNLFRMFGLGSSFSITPLRSGKVSFRIKFMPSGIGTGGNNSYKVCWGTGAPPANGTAASGTVVGGTDSGGTTIAIGATPAPIVRNVIITGLSLGVAIWFDIQGAKYTSNSAVSMSGIEATIEELPY